MDDAIDVRAALAADAPALLRMQRRLDTEVDTLLLEPGERTESVATLAARLERADRCACDLFLIAIINHAIVGYLEANGGRHARNRHVVYLALGVRPAWQRRGIGARFLEAAQSWAGATGHSRLELTVMAHNRSAVRLYERFGFAREGVRREALVVRGRPVDEYFMAKLMNPGPDAQ